MDKDIINNSIDVAPQARSVGLDVVKGLLIILMVIGHSGAPKGLEVFISVFHMPAFFVISGFLLKPKYLSQPGHFTIHKIRTIWWPFVLWTVIFILCHNLFYRWHLIDSIYGIPEFKVMFIHGSAMLRTEQLLGGFWFLRSLLIASLFCIVWFRLFGMNLISICVCIITSQLASILILSGIIPQKLYFAPPQFASNFFLCNRHRLCAA